MSRSSDSNLRNYEDENSSYTDFSITSEDEEKEIKNPVVSIKEPEKKVVKSVLRKLKNLETEEMSKTKSILHIIEGDIFL